MNRFVSILLINNTLGIKIDKNKIKESKPKILSIPTAKSSFFNEADEVYFFIKKGFRISPIIPDGVMELTKLPNADVSISNNFFIFFNCKSLLIKFHLKAQIAVEIIIKKINPKILDQEILTFSIS